MSFVRLQIVMVVTQLYGLFISNQSKPGSYL